VSEPVDVDALVIALVREVVPWGASGNRVSSSSSLGDELGIDSMGMVVLAFRIGEELGLELDEGDVDLAEIRTVGDVQATARRLLERAHERA
jgi:acyl carrier protein